MVRVRTDINNTDITMGQPAQTQPWKMNSAVTAYRTRCAEAGVPIEPSKGRANFYPEGAMMFNGGQGAGNGVAQVFYDTEKAKNTVQVRHISDESISTC